MNALDDLTGDYRAKAQLALDSVDNLANKYLSVEAGGNGLIAIPNSVMPISLYVSSVLKMSAGVGEINADDRQAIQNAAVMVGEDNTYGGALQFSAKF